MAGNYPLQRCWAEKEYEWPVVVAIKWILVCVLRL